MKNFDFVLITFYYRENVRQLELVLINLGCKKTHKEKVKSVHKHHFHFAFTPVPDLYLHEVLERWKTIFFKAHNFEREIREGSENLIFWHDVPTDWFPRI